MIVRYKVLYDVFNYRVSRIPIEYILKVKFFYEYKFYIFYPLLIPRNDTIKILYLFRSVYSKSFIKYVLDCGCGSGILSISFFSIFKLLKYVALDSSYLSFNLFKFNFKLRQISYFYCNWFYLFFGIKKFDIIVSNPPYLSYDELSYNFISYFFEYRNALLANMSGFYDLRDIILFSYDILFKNGILLLEHSYSQAKQVRKVMISCGFINVCTFYDFGNLSRFTYAEK